MTSLYPVEDATQRILIAMVTLFTILPTCAVGLRLWARKLSGQWLQWSDIFILLDYAFLLGFWAVVIFSKQITPLFLHPRQLSHIYQLNSSPD